MPSPFDMFYNSPFTYQKPLGTSGLGEKVYSEPKSFQGTLKVKHGIIRSANGDIAKYQGKLRYDHEIVPLVEGDKVFSGTTAYIIISFDETGNIPDVAKRKVALLQWQL